MAKKKVFTFEDQLEKMNSLYGIPVEDGVNVFTNHRKTVETLITEEVEKGTKNIEFETPLGAIGFAWAEEQSKIDSNGTEYTVPAHYTGSFAFPSAFLDLANANVDFSGIPSKEEVETEKAKVKGKKAA